MKKEKLKFFLRLSGLTLITLFAIKYLPISIAPAPLPSTPTSSSSSSPSLSSPKTHDSPPIKKKTPPPLNKKKSSSQISSSSQKINPPQKKEKEKIFIQMKKRYFNALPSYVEWDISFLSQTPQGQIILIELNDPKEKKSTSYNALVESRTGRILATWNKKREEEPLKLPPNHGGKKRR